MASLKLREQGAAEMTARCKAKERNAEEAVTRQKEEE